MNLDRPVAPDPYSLLPAVPALTVSSTSIQQDARLPEEQVFDGWGLTGGNVSPQLSWAGAPAGTKGYAVTCFDPDAPTPSGFWHWLLVGIPAEVTNLDAGAGLADMAPRGAFHMANDFGDKRYDGAAPPEGDHDHRYMFAVHALDTDDLGLDDTASAAVTAFTLGFHTLARGVITATYTV
jgi:Raf kinase inhibitor-like YbhB/YbcL family protein